MHAKKKPGKLCTVHNERENSPSETQMVFVFRIEELKKRLLYSPNG